MLESLTKQGNSYLEVKVGLLFSADEVVMDKMRVIQARKRTILRSAEF